jgi:UDP-N-acetylglucosamine diphosphorylase/glucosamine-1-phosphate N-acetyltransferase
MTRWLVVFEDSGWSALRPLTDLLPTPALAFGASHLAARWAARSGCRWLATEARAGALAAWRHAPARAPERPAPSDLVLVANAAALPGDWLSSLLGSKNEALFRVEDRIAAAQTTFEKIAPGLGQGERFERFVSDLGLETTTTNAKLLRWPWQLIEWNEEALLEDLASLTPERAGEVHELAAVLEGGRVRIERGARVDPLAVLDAREGPIHLGEGVIVHSHTVVEGPCVIGSGTQLFGGLVARSTIGPGCRLAGEVDTTIWQGWANKRHHGFVGHSVIGEWSNLGALTTTSDLKNNYRPVRVWVNGREVDSGNPKVGSLIGSHVKTGIGSLLPTGASIGTGSNLFGGGRFAPKHVPAFTWWDGERSIEHKLEPFLATARIATSRRSLTLSAEEEAALRALHQGTAAERAAAAAGPRQAQPA